jgi:hypothetical protein
MKYEMNVKHHPPLHPPFPYQHGFLHANGGDLVLRPDLVERRPALGGSAAAHGARGVGRRRTLGLALFTLFCSRKKKQKMADTRER